VAALLARVSDDHKVPGLAAAGIVDGAVAYVGVHGWRDAERQLPLTADTPSRWYSISKPLTALALARLVASGKLSWDQPVGQVVPGLKFADPVATEYATVADCLLHRTGLPSGDWTWWDAPSDSGELLRRLPHIPCPGGFRAGHQYQNLGFTIVAEVFKAAGTDWHQAIRDLLEPLGIKPLTRLGEFIASDRALGYGPNGFSAPIPVADFDFEGIAPASALCGSITDLARIAGALAKGGADLLPRAVWQEVTRSQWALAAPVWPELRQPCVSLAGHNVVYRGELVMQWAGGWRGYVAHVLALPSRRVAACAVANRTSSAAAEVMAFEVLDRAAGWDPLPWSERFLEQKKKFRKAGEKRLADRLSRPVAPWPATTVCGRYWHPGYGDLMVVEAGRGLQLRFRHVDLPLTPRPDGMISADGGTVDFAELCWDLRPEVEDRRVVAWRFNPDCPAAPCRFVRQD